MVRARPRDARVLDGAGWPVLRLPVYQHRDAVRILRSEASAEGHVPIVFAFHVPLAGGGVLHAAASPSESDRHVFLSRAGSVLRFPLDHAGSLAPAADIPNVAALEHVDFLFTSVGVEPCRTDLRTCVAIHGENVVGVCPDRRCDVFAIFADSTLVSSYASVVVATIVPVKRC